MSAQDQSSQVDYGDVMFGIQMVRDDALAMLRSYGTSQLQGPFDIRKVGTAYLNDPKKRAAINKIVGVG